MEKVVETLVWDRDFDQYKSHMAYDFAIAIATAKIKEGEDARHFYLRFCDAYEDANRVVRGLSENIEHIEAFKPEP